MAVGVLNIIVVASQRSLWVPTAISRTRMLSLFDEVESSVLEFSAAASQQSQAKAQLLDWARVSFTFYDNYVALFALRLNRAHACVLHGG